jgi:hypothetical protein
MNLRLLWSLLQVRYFEVSEAELEDLRERFKNGQYSIDIEHKTFSMAQYNDMLASESRHCYGLARPAIKPAAASVRVSTGLHIFGTE